MTITISREQGITLDPAELAETRCIAQASSGGGKSHLLRLIAEQAAASVPVIVIDPEGELHTLREVIPAVLVGPGGEIPCEPESAARIARGLLEQACSAIIDLSDLHQDRHGEFVAGFIASAMAAPSRCWRPTLFLIDEAHRFCPQGGRKDDAKLAVADLMSRGRKRGYGGVLVTQRISKLDKDAVGEAANKFVGLANLDLDIVRAADLIGVTKNDAQVLRSMKPGEWFGAGPAFAHDGVVRFRADQPETRKPERGVQKTSPASDPEAVLAIAERVGVAAADDRPTTLEDAEREIDRLLRELDAKPAPGLTHEEAERMVSEAVTARDRLWSDSISRNLETIADGVQGLEKLANPADSPESAADSHGRVGVVLSLDEIRNPDFPTFNEPAAKRHTDQADGFTSKSAPGRVLYALAWWAAVGVDAPTPDQISPLANISAKSSTWRGARAELFKAGLVDYRGHGTRLTPAGAAAAPRVERPSLSGWHTRLVRVAGGGTTQAVLDYLLGRKPGASHDLEEICRAVEVSPTSSTIRTALASLRKLGIIAKGQPIRLTDLAFPEGLK